jgi:predicted nucleic acid-binding Zn ribbon protein
MERAGRTLAKMKLPDAVSSQDLAFAAWTSAVGKRVARHAWPKALVRGNLVVETEDAIWQKQLYHLRFQIMPKLLAILGDGIVRDLEFRTATPRRPPQAAQNLTGSKPADEADRIEDSVFRLVYKQARKKASA